MSQTTYILECTYIYTQKMMTCTTYVQIIKIKRDTASLANYHLFQICTLLLTISLEQEI